MDQTPHNKTIMTVPIAAVLVSVSALLTELATEHDTDMLLMKQMNIVSLFISTIGFLLADMMYDQLLYTVFSLAVVAIPLLTSIAHNNPERRALYAHVASYIRLFLWTIGAFYALIYRDNIVSAVAIAIAVVLNLAVLAIQQAKEKTKTKRHNPV